MFKFGSYYMKQMRAHSLNWELHSCYMAVVSSSSSSFPSSFKLPDGVDQIILECREPGFLQMSITAAQTFASVTATLSGVICSHQEPQPLQAARLSGWFWQHF